MKFTLENFESKKLDKNQLFPIGGTATLEATGTSTNCMSTKTTGTDCDSGTADADEDPAN